VGAADYRERLSIPGEPIPMSANASTDTQPDAARAGAKPDAEKDAAKRQRERVEKRLAAPAAKGSGSFTGTDGRTIDYDTHCAFVPVAGADGEPEAAVYTFAYLAKREPGTPPRPLCFAFNGGPGSASVWLHLGALGPQRVVVNDDGSMPAPPYRTQPNPLSWFAHFDLVFIDPPHTGWSMTASDAARKKMLSVDGDVAALAEVMRAWLAEHRRFGSALYLAGESYGTTRGAALVDAMAGQGIAFAGVVLVSVATEIRSLAFDHGNDLAYALFLPGFANAAQFHGLLKGPEGESPEAARRAAEAFCESEYPAALHAGARLAPKAFGRIAQRVAELTGLPRALVEQLNLRVSDESFFFEAMREQGRIVGRLDARVTGPMAARRTRQWEFDPGIEGIEAPYTMAALAYCGEALNIDRRDRYEVLNIDVNRQWNWNRGEANGNGYASTSADLARAMRRNPHLKVFVASGRYDLGTPYSATDWTLAQLDVPREMHARIAHHYYDAGHMMYTRQADLVQLHADLGAWIAG
jgi:carboxypeptidase C (cathepsin A)